MELATAADVEYRLGRAFTDTETRRVDALLVDASAAVRRVATQHFTPDTSTDVRLTVGRAGKVRLPQRPVTNVTTVTNITGTEVPYVQVGNELRLDLDPLNAWEIHPFRCGVSEVLVTYEHGGDVPADIVGVVCAMTLRGLGTNPTNPAGIAQESIDGYSYTSGGGVAVATTSAAGGMGMLPSEIAICEAYRRPRGPIPSFA